MIFIPVNYSFKVTTGIKSFVSVVQNVASWTATAVDIITQFLDQFRSKLILQLIKDFSRVYQKLLKYFNGTIVSASFVPLLPVWPVIFSLLLNESVIESAALKLTIVPLASEAGSSLQNCHKIPDVCE